MRISDWSSDVCSSDLYPLPLVRPWLIFDGRLTPSGAGIIVVTILCMLGFHLLLKRTTLGIAMRATADNPQLYEASGRSEEHTSELQSLMRISYAVFCLTKQSHKRIKNRSNK